MLQRPRRGLRFSAARADDTVLVIAESGIDALCCGVLHPDPITRYASTGGAPNPNQPALLGSAVEKMEGASIIIATDNDAPGRKHAEQFGVIARETTREDLQIIQYLP